MKRCLAILLSALLLLSVVPMVSADNYNDGALGWGGMYDPDAPCTHFRSTQVEAVASTCAVAGHGAYTLCIDCDAVLAGSNEKLPLLEHTYVLTEDIAPTCTQEGKQVYTCVDCGDSYTQTWLPLDHMYREEVVEPTCTEMGYTIYTCGMCGDSYTDDYTDMLPHTYVLVEDIAPTCTQEGKQVYTCVGCGDSYTQTWLPLDHRYREEVVEPTCTEQGYTIYTCGMCGDSYEANYTDTVPHTYVLVEDIAPTCTNEGKQVYTCVGCGDSYIQTWLPLDHMYREEVIEPTCMEMGYTVYTCHMCGDSYTGDYTDTVPHTYVLTEDIAPTCTQEGKQVYTCVGCGDSYTQTWLPLDHMYREEVIEPTCTEQGYTVYTCHMCGDSYTGDYTDAPGHSYDDDRDADCNVCGDIREVAIAKPGDVNGDGRVNNKDLGLVQQHLADWDVTIDLEAADVNNDGRVNNKDLGLMQQYLADWDVVLK